HRLELDIGAGELGADLAGYRAESLHTDYIRRDHTGAHRRDIELTLFRHFHLQFRLAAVTGGMRQQYLDPRAATLAAHLHPLDPAAELGGPADFAAIPAAHLDLTADVRELHHPAWLCGHHPVEGSVIRRGHRCGRHEHEQRGRQAQHV